MYEFCSNNEVIEIPDEIDSLPVVYVKFSYKFMPGILKKIIIGNNLLFINNYTRIITELETVVIKKGYCGTGSVISRFTSSFCNYSVNFMDFQISKELNYKFMNNYFVSKDEIMNHILFDKTKCPKITLSLKDCFNNSNNE